MFKFKLLINFVFCAVLGLSTSAQENFKRYEVKSGKMTLVSEIFGKEQDMTIYFDEYGTVEYSETLGVETLVRSCVLCLQECSYMSPL